MACFFIHIIIICIPTVNQFTVEIFNGYQLGILSIFDSRRHDLEFRGHTSDLPFKIAAIPKNAGNDRWSSFTRLLVATDLDSYINQTTGSGGHTSM